MTQGQFLTLKTDPGGQVFNGSNFDVTPAHVLTFELPFALIYYA